MKYKVKISHNMIYYFAENCKKIAEDLAKFHNTVVIEIK
jgi:hypothetical protein